jgi:hypothetical protein
MLMLIVAYVDEYHMCSFIETLDNAIKTIYYNIKIVFAKTFLIRKELNLYRKKLKVPSLCRR